MSILLSVNPPYAGMIVDGEKTIEWRKKPLPVGTAYIYETKKNGGCGMVIGEVQVTFSFNVNLLLDLTTHLERDGKVKQEDLIKYAGGRQIIANNVQNAKRYEKPIPLSSVFMYPCRWEYDCCTCKHWNPNDYGRCEKVRELHRPPQSWCYCEDLKGETK